MSDMAKQREQDKDKQPGDGSGSVTLRMDTEMITQVDALAKQQERSRSQIIVFAVREYLDRQGKGKGTK